MRVVTQGQFFERPAIIPVGDSALDGLSTSGDARPPLLIIPPPPERGSMDHSVLAELAWAASRASFPTLRFNFRGVGASQGERGDESQRLADAEAALRLLEENTGVASAVVASFGASAPTIVALSKLHPGIAGLCFIGPEALEFAELARAGTPLLAVIGEKDASAPQAALAAAIREAGGQMEIIPGADANFQSKLPDVGSSVVRWLSRLRPG